MQKLLLLAIIILLAIPTAISVICHYFDKPKSNQAHFEDRSEEHTSELQSRPHLVCRLLLEKKKHLHGRIPWKCLQPSYPSTLETLIQQEMEMALHLVTAPHAIHTGSWRSGGRSPRVSCGGP